MGVHVVRYTGVFVWWTVASLAWAGGALAGESSSDVPDWQNVHAGWTKARAEQKPLLIYVSLPDCRYCRLLEQESLADRRVRDLIRNSFVISRADGQRDAELIQRWGIRTFPTLLVISPQNKVVVSISGYVSADRLATQLSACKEAHTASSGENAVR